MKITCALSQSQIEKLYANVYGYMLNKGNDFEPKQYMIDLFDKLAKKKDVETAAKFLQQVPSLIGTASFRPGLEQFEISTDILKPLINQFKRDENGLVNVVKYFNPVLDPEVKKELVEKKANDAFDIIEVDTNRIITQDFDFKPYSALSTTMQQFITQNPKDKTNASETLDPSRKVIYNTLDAIRSVVNDNTAFKEVVYQGKVLKLKPVRLNEINPVLLDKTTNALLNKAGAINAGKKGVESVTPINEIFLMVLSDSKGELLYFTEDGNITTQDKGGRLVYQFLRDARKDGNNIMITDMYGYQNSILDPATIANKAGVPVEVIEEQQNKEFKELYDYRQKLINNEKVDLLDIVSVSNGIAEYAPDKLNLSNISTILNDNDAAIRSIDTVNSPRSGFIEGQAVITIKGVEYAVDRPNISLDLINKIATVLTNKDITNKKKYRFVSTFLADKASPSTRKHNITYLPNSDVLLFEYSETTFDEGYSKMKSVNLDSPTAKNDIVKALQFASGKNGKYYTAKMTISNEALDKGYQDYNLNTNTLDDNYSNYIDLLKTLDNTNISVDLNPAGRTFNSYLRFALPNEFTEQLANAQKNTDEIVKDDLFETLSEPEDEKPVFGVKATREKLINALEKNETVSGTISFVTGSKWLLTTPEGQVVEFFNKENNITNEDVISTATLNLIPEITLDNKPFTNVIEVKVGNKFIGYVRETEDFSKPVKQKSIEEIEAEINQVIDGKGEATPEDDGAASVFFLRKGSLPADVTEKQIKDAKKWWTNSPLNKHIGFKEVANIVNSDAYARFTKYGAVLNGNLGIIELADKGSMVDVYHEAWHGFSQLYLSKAEKKALYKEVQKKMGSKADFFDIEENLAEAFREYVRTGKALKGAPKTNSIFKKILNFLRELFGKGSVTDVTDIKRVNELFNELYLGTELNKYTPSIANVMFNTLNRSLGIIKPGTADEQVLNRQDSNKLKDSMDSIISDIVDNEAKRSNKKSGTLSILLDSRNREPLYILIKQQLNNKLELSKTQLQDTPNNLENALKREILENRIRILQTGLDNYGDTKEGLIGYHVENSTYDLMKQKYTVLELDEEGNLFDPANIKNTERYGDKEEGQKSLIELAGKETLYILKSLHKGKINKDTNLIEFTYDDLGFKQLADFRSTWNTVVRTIGGVQDPQEMYDRLANEGETDSQLRQLVQTKLANPKLVTEDIAKNNQYEFKATTSIWQDFSKSKIPYIQLTIRKTETGEKEVYDYNGNPIPNKSYKTYDYSSAVTDASIEAYNIIRKFEDKFKSNLDNPYVERLGIDNIPTLNIQQVVKDFGVNGKLNTEKSFAFARALGFALDDLSIIKGVLNKKDNKTIEQFGLSYIFDVVKKLSDKENLENVSSATKKAILNFRTNPINTLMNDIPAGVIGNSKVNQKNKVLEIAKLQSRYGLDTSNNMVLNAERNRVSEFIENNSISKQVSALNNASKLSDLWTSDKYQHMAYLDPRINAYTKRLGIIRSLYDMSSAEQLKRSNKSLTLFMDSGTQIADEDGGLNTANLDIASKRLQEMNTMLKSGVQEFLRHASKSSAFGVKIDSGIIGSPDKSGFDNYLWVDSDMFVDGTAYDYAFLTHFLPYIEGEAERIYKFRKNKTEYSKYAGYNRKVEGGFMAGEIFTAFDDIIEDDTKKLIYKAIDAAIANNESFDLRTYIRTQNNPLATTLRNQVRSYFDNQSKVNYNNLQELKFIDPELIDKMKSLNTPEDQIEKKLVEVYTYNSWIQNFETAVLFYGDIAQYNHAKQELHKRNTGSTSGGRAFRTDVAARNFVNSFLSETSYAKKYNKPTINYNGTYNTAIVQDIKRTSEYLGEIEKGLTDEYTKRYATSKDPNKEAEIKRRVAIEIAKYVDMEEGDGQGYISFDAYRNLKYLENSWSNDQEILFQKIKNGEEVKASDIKEFFPVYKLQNYGPLANKEIGLPITAMHKFALFPLIPNVIAGSDLESLHLQMIDKNIQYVTFQTGSKVGSVTSAVNKDGDPVADEIYVGDQKKLKADITFTPNTIYLEYLKNVTNVPNAYKNKTVFSTQLRKLILKDMYKDKKIINDANESAVKRYEKAVDSYSQLLKMELLQEVDYEYDIETGTYKGNISKFLEVVERELGRRNIPEHLIEFIGLNRDTTIKTDLSLHLVADQIEAIITGLIEKRLIKQKVKGEALVQVASSMSNGLWDTKLKKGTKEEIMKYLGTNNLPFYNKDANTGKTNAMKVAIALQGDFSNLLKLNALDGQPIATRARLNDMIKEDAWLDIADNRKSVTLAAVRIPVQGLNSMEFMEVYEFLDPSAGNIIIPPTEIVAKSGADFDVDKLTTFMPAIDSYGNFVKTGLSNDELSMKLDGVENENVGKGLIKNQKAALENELIMAISGILELSDNYASLVRPNDTYLMKDDIADELEKYVTSYDRFSNFNRKTPGFSPTKTLEVGYNLHNHEVNMIGKRVLGMLAIENSLHPVMNSIGLSLPKTYKNLEFDQDLNRNKEGTTDFEMRLFLPHNKTEDGRISLSGVDTVDGLDNIGEMFSQMMNGAVDVEKNPWIFFIQGNYEMIPMITFLLKAGVPRKQAIYFVSNPIVREYAKEQRKLKSAYAKITGTVEENFGKSFVKYTAATNALTKFGVSQAGKKITNKTYFKSVNDAVAKQGVLNDEGLFDETSMRMLIENPEAPEYKDQAIAMFLHFLELEKSTRGYNALKFVANPDTKTSKTLQEIIRRNVAFDEAAALSTLEKGSVNELLNSVLGSFYNNKIIGDLVAPVFKLRNNDVVTDYILDRLKNNSSSITKAFGTDQDGTRKFITSFKNAIPNYIFQNYMSNFIDESGEITSMPKYYKGIEVINKAGAKEGAEIIDNKLYIDKARLEKEYAEELYAASNTNPGNYNSEGLRGFGNTINLFNTESAYFKYVFERAIQKDLYSPESVKEDKDYLRFNEFLKDDKQAYLAYINQRALVYAFNRKIITGMDNDSYTNMLLNMINDYPILASKYNIISQFTKPNVKESVLSLNDVSSLKDGDTAEIYYQNLKDLADETVKKVSDPIENRKISKMFEMLPLIAIYQHGIGYSKNGFNEALPYDNFIEVMQTASEIFMNKQLNEATLNTIFDKLLAQNFKTFKDYTSSPEAYNKPTTPTPVDIMSQEEAAAMLEGKGLKVTEEVSTTQPSTSVKEGVSVLFESNPELANVGTPQQYSQYLDGIFPDSKVKDIVYHWSAGSQISEQFGDDLGRVKGIWISKDPNQWKDIIKNKSKRLGINQIKKHVLIINANNIWVDSTLSSPEGSNFPKGYDTIAAYEEADLAYSGDLKPEFKNIEGFEAVIKLKNQTYELGTKQDIEGFKNFVANSIQPSQISTQGIVNRPDVNLREKYFKNSEVKKLSEVLGAISKSNHPLSTLAKHLNQFSNINNADIALEDVDNFEVTDGFTSNAYYDIYSNRVRIAEFANVNNGSAETLLLHEILHALSYKALRKGGNYNKDFQKLYEHSIQQLGAFDVSAKTGPYANYTIDEFFVALFTDAKFIKQLSELAPIDVKKYSNLLQEIVDHILNLLKINKGDSVYDQAFAVATNILQEESDYVNAMNMAAQEQDNINFEINAPEGLPGIPRTSTDCQ
jgi:hypothetical protein